MLPHSREAEAEKVWWEWDTLWQVNSNGSNVLHSLFLRDQPLCADGGEVWGLRICTGFSIRGVCLCPEASVACVTPHTIPAKIAEFSCQAAVEQLLFVSTGLFLGGDSSKDSSERPDFLAL